MPDAAARVMNGLSLQTLQGAMPSNELFAGKDWLLSPQPLMLSSAEVEELEKLGHRLLLFTRAANQLYNLSAQGRRAPWVAEYLDRGKPKELVQLAREKTLRQQIPRVIRPDLVLTEEGWTLAEIDSVPGGIGLTGWLSQTYAGAFPTVLGGARGMIDGFRRIFPKGSIVISEESATYRPEMEWLAEEVNRHGGSISVAPAEHFRADGGEVYRFFELFDLPNIPGATEMLRRAADGSLHITPPPKPQLEEKMWLALFWMRPLQDFWTRELRENHRQALQRVIPRSWIVDPQPLPQHAVIPDLEIHDWSELAAFSQRERELILKISGFSDRAWGSRGVSVGQDLSQQQWQEAVENALEEFDAHPFVLQRFHKGRLVEHPFYDRESGELQVMKGRARLCPYYFVLDGRARLGGALATICPPDKKLLHGMRDAILVPCAGPV